MRMGADSATVTNCGFVVLAPAARIEEGAFAALDKASIARAVKYRAKCFDGDPDNWCDHAFTPILERCDITAISWEHVIAKITEMDPAAGEGLIGFYSQCLRYNPLSLSRHSGSAPRRC